MKKRIRTVAVVTAITGGLLTGAFVGNAAAAETQQFVGGTPSTNKLVKKGSGSASADATAKSNGALTAKASATGGAVLPLLPLGATGAFGYAQTARQIDVTPGSYQVSVTYQNTTAAVREAHGGLSTPLFNSIAQFVCHHGCHGQDSHPVVRFDEIKTGKGTVTKTMRISVPAGEIGHLLVTGRVLADADARKKGATAQSSVSTTGTIFQVTKI